MVREIINADFDEFMQEKSPAKEEYTPDFDFVGI